MGNANEQSYIRLLFGIKALLDEPWLLSLLDRVIQFGLHGEDGKVNRLYIKLAGPNGTDLRSKPLK